MMRFTETSIEWKSNGKEDSKRNSISKTKTTESNKRTNHCFERLCSAAGADNESESAIRFAVM